MNRRLVALTLLTRALALVGAGTILALVLLLSPLPVSLARAWSVGSAPRPADVIVVLGGGVTWPGVLLCGGVQRVQHAVRLYRQGYAGHIIVSGGLDARKAVPAEAELMGSLAVEMGVPKSAIVLEGRASRTYENGAEAAAIMRDRGWQTAIVVTDAVHMRRTKLVFDRLGVRAFPSASPTPQVITQNPAERVVLLHRLVYEVLGTLVYRVRGWA